MVVKSYSEEALRWCGPADRGRSLPPIKGLDYAEMREISERTREANAAAQQTNAVILNKYAKEHAGDLGLVANRGGQVVVQARSFHPVYRIGPDGRLLVEFFVEFVQKSEERIDPNDLQSTKFTMYGGSTVIFTSQGEVRYVIEKPIDSALRLERQRAYLMEASVGSAFTRPSGAGPSFAAIHRGC